MWNERSAIRYSCTNNLCYLLSGAVKSNLGHLEGSSGVAGLIKTILVLEKGVIPPNANFEHLNPKIDAEFLNLKVRTSFRLQAKRKFLRVTSFRQQVCLGPLKDCDEHLSTHSDSVDLTHTLCLTMHIII